MDSGHDTRHPVNHLQAILFASLPSIQEERLAAILRLGCVSQHLAEQEKDTG